MLRFKITDTTANIIVTLTEKVTLTNPHYLFVFHHAISKDVVAFVRSDADDISNYKKRYNEFIVSPADLFTGKNVGEWLYRVYEQDSADNTEELLAGNLLENGKLRLERDSEFAFTTYHKDTSFKVYNG